MGRWDERLINQVSNKLKQFLQRILQEIMKKDNMYLEHQTLGRSVICPRDPANQHIILKIVEFQISKDLAMIYIDSIVVNAMIQS